MSRTRPIVILFCKFPEAGKVKTRLGCELGDERAVAAHRELTEQTVRTLKRLSDHWHRRIQFAPSGQEAAMRGWLGDGFEYRPQSGGDLGQRMLAAGQRAEAEGFVPMVLIGSDCPDLKRHHLLQAADLLKEADLVLGPCPDGGYYLIAFRSPAPELFQEMKWSQSSVCEETRRRAQDLGLKVAELEMLSDVDTMEDFRQWKADGFTQERNPAP